MALKLSPRKINVEQSKSLEQALRKQEIQRGTPKSLDSDFPVFEFTPGTKYLVYVPRHVITDEEGVEELRMDRPLIYPINMKNRYSKVRSVAGLENYGYSEDPIAEALNDSYNLANERIDAECKLQGLDPMDKTSDKVTAIRRRHFDEMPVKSPYRMLTFPIIVIETGESLKNVVLDEDGNPIGTPYWYSISEMAYEKKWLEALETSEDELNHPGGALVILNFPLNSKNEKAPLHEQKRDAARDFTVTVRSNPPEQIKKQYSKWNKETEDWDVLKSASTVVSNLLLEPENLESYAEELKEYIANLRLSSAVSEATSPSALADNFEVTESVTEEPLGVLPEGSVDAILEDD